jgi:hypothetical protein
MVVIDCRDCQPAPRDYPNCRGKDDTPQSKLARVKDAALLALAHADEMRRALETEGDVEQID